MVVTDPVGTERRYGKPMRICLADNATARTFTLNAALRAGEACMDGRLLVEVGDILALFDIVTSNLRWQRDNPVRFALQRQARLAAPVGWH